MATATRTTLRATPPSRTRTEIRILDNPLAAQDPSLARDVEAILQDVLASEDVGVLEVRFRVCRELTEGLRFICKVENPPVPDLGLQRQCAPWRWWSPLMETAQDFRAALQDGVQVRRERVAALRVALY